MKDEFHTHEFYRIAQIKKHPSLFIADFSTIPGKYPSESEIYLRFIIAPRANKFQLSNNYLQSIRSSPDLRYNLDAIESDANFVTLFDMLFFHQMDLWK